MGADPNTIVSRQPNEAELKYIEDTLGLARQLALASNGAVPYPSAIEKMLALARKLPGDSLQKSNLQFYALLGIDPNGMNEPSKALTPQSETTARQLIAKWRPYSEEATGALFAQLDFARDLGGSA